MKKILKVLLILVLIVIAAAVLLFGWLTAAEYRPAPVEDAEVLRTGENASLAVGDSVTVLSWNVGYGGLGKDSDFFMDGGKDSRSADRETVGRYLEGIHRTIVDQDPDLVLLQEVDTDSSRTYGID